MSTDVLLHVVYAGRGDAFFLEYTYNEGTTATRQFIVLDGGPFTYDVLSHQVAPYYKYFLSAARQIWATSFPSIPRFAPSAMINSHPHDDHLKGLLHLLKYGKADQEMDFAGPFILPNIKSDGLTLAKKLMTELKWKANAGFSQDVKGIICDFPSSASQILSFNQRPPSPPGDEIDKSAENKTSILMHTNPATVSNQGDMYFTGDNVGFIINPFIKDKQYSIYKIQHHGSCHNTQIIDKSKRISFHVLKETALRSLFYSARSEFAEDQLFDIPESSARLLFDFICDEYKLTPTTAQQFLGKLEKRHNNYIQACVKNLVDKDGNSQPQLTEAFAGVPMDPFPEPWAVFEAAQVWVNGLAIFDNGFSDFWEVKETSGRIYQTKLDWWLKWPLSNSWGRHFLNILNVSPIVSFFKSFQADAYVISGNEVHSHPSAATILGLGMALKSSGRRVPIYLTEGKTISTSNLGVLEFIFQEDINTLFNGVDAEIRYLDSRAGFYMTLNGNRDRPAGPTGRDVNQRTVGLHFTPAGMVQARALAEAIESRKAVLPFRRGLAPNTVTQYDIYCDSNDVKYYLDIRSPTPSLSLSSAGPYFVAESWQTGGATYDKIQLTLGNPPVGMKVFDIGDYRTSNERQFWQLKFIDSIGDPFTFYQRQSDNVVVVGPDVLPIPAGFNLAFFTFFLPTETTLSLSMTPFRPPTATIPSLRKYCEDAGVTISPGFSGADTLMAIVKASIFTQLDFTLDFETDVLAFAVDLDISTVDYADSKLSLPVNAASIRFLVTPDSKIPFGTKMIRVLSVTLEIIWPDTIGLGATLTINAERGITITDTKAVANALKESSLRKCLEGMGCTAEALKILTVPDLLGFLIDDHGKMFDIFLNKIPSAIVIAGLDALQPDLDSSTVDAYFTATGQVAIQQANIICDLKSSSSWANSISVAGIMIEIGEIILAVENTMLVSQKISLTGSASIATGSGTGVAIGLSIVLQGDGLEDLVFSFSTLAAVDQLPKILPGVVDVSGLKVPFSESALGNLTTSMIGFSLHQPVLCVSDYSLRSVFAVVSFDDWKKFLPSAFPSDKIDSAFIRVFVYDPTNSDLRKTAVSIEFTLKLAAPLPPLLQLSFAAEPLVLAKDYEYCLRLTASDRALTLANVSQAIGLGDISSGILTGIPIVGQFLTAISVLELSVAVVEEDSSYTFENWSLSLYIDGFVVVPDIMSINNTTISMQYVNDWYECNAKGQLLFSGPDIIVDIELKTPMKDVPGQLLINAPTGLSTADLLAAFKFPNLSSIPVIGTLLSIELDSAHCNIGYTEESPDVLCCLGAGISFGIDSCNLGVFTFAGLNIELEYFTKDDIFGPGFEQRAFAISAGIADGTLQAEVSYDSHTGILKASLTRVMPITIAELLVKILPSTVVNILEMFIGTMAFDDAELVFDTKTETITSFDVTLSNDEALAVGKLALTSLHVVYTAAEPAVPPKTTLQITGTMQQGSSGATFIISCLAEDSKDPTSVSLSIVPLTTDSLSLSGFISLLGISSPQYDPPDGCPKFIDLQVLGVFGTIAITTKPANSLTIKSFDAYVQSTGELTILKELGIKISGIKLEIHYDSEAGTTGKVAGKIQVSTKGAFIWVEYTKDSKGEQYYGIFDLKGQGTICETADMANQFLKPSEYGFPPDLKIPPSLPLNVIYGKLIPDVSAEIWGTGTSSWNPTSSGVPLNTASLGGRIKVYEPHPLSSKGPITTRVYEIYLIGELTFTGFASLEARLNISSIGTQSFTAALTKMDASGDEIETLSKELDTDTGSDWNSLVPQGTTPISFDKDGLFLYIDFKKSTFCLFGSVNKVGAVTILGRPKFHGDGRCYFGSLVVQDLGSIWKDFGDTVDSIFNFSLIIAEVMAYDGTLGDLDDDLSAAYINFKSEHVTITDASTALAPLKKDEVLGVGAAFFAVISLTGDNPMTNGLVLCSEPVTPPTIILYAKVTPVVSQSLFIVDVNQLTLFGGAMIITGAGSYTEKCFTLKDGTTLTLSIPGTDKPIIFSVRLTITPNDTKFSIITAPIDFPITNPFGGMFNVEITKLRISGHFTTKETITKRDCTLSGTVTLGGSPPLTATGSILFADGKPRVASVKFDNLNITQVFSQILDPGSTAGASWPSAYIPITITAVEIYYADGNQTIDDVSYISGYNISSLFSLFGVEFQMLVTIPSDRSGLTITGSYVGAVDLVIVQLGPYTIGTSPTLGPSMLIDTRDRKNTIYTAEAGLILFGLTGINLALSYETEDQAYTGEVTYTGTILGKDNPTVKVKYTPSQGGEDGKFEVLEWPILKEFGEVLDIVKGLIDAAENDDPGKCGGLGDLFLDNVSTKFKINLSMAAGDGKRFEDPPLVTVTLSPNLEIRVADKPIYAFDLLPIPLQFKGPFVVDGLEGAIESLIKSSVTAIGDAILNNKGAFATLVSAMAVDKFGKELIKRLLCRKCESEEVINKGEEIADEDNGKSVDPGEEAAKDFADVLESAELDAASSLFATGGTAFGTFMGVISEFLTMAEWLIDLLSDPSSWRDKRDKAKAKRDALTDAQAKARAYIENAMDLSSNPAPASTFIPQTGPQTQVKVDWSNSKPNKDGFNYNGYRNFSWTVKANTTGGVNDPSQQQDTFNTQYVFTDSEYQYAATVYAWVKAKYVSDNGDTFISTDWQPATVATQVPYLRPPGGIVFTITEQVATVAIQPPVNGRYTIQVAGNDSASRNSILYQFNLFDSGSAPIHQLVMNIDVPPAPPPSVGAYVQTVSTDPSKAHDSLFVMSSSAFTVNPPPANLMAEIDVVNVNVSWDQAGPPPPPPTPDYELVVTDIHEKVITTATVKPLPIAIGHRKVQLSSPDFVEGFQIIIFVRTAPIALGTIGLYNRDTITISDFLMPTITDGSFYDISSATLNLNLIFDTSVSPSATFIVQENFQSGPITDPIIPTSIPLPGNSVLLQVPGFKAPFPVSVQVAMSSGTTHGPWSNSWLIPPAASLPLPAIIPQGVFGLESLTLSWQAPENATEILIEAYNDIPNHKVKKLTLPASSNTAVLSTGDNLQIYPSARIIVRCTSLAQNVVGGSSVTPFVFFVTGGEGGK